jgi:succinylglutamic semialdehyde dehydrogenase
VARAGGRCYPRGVDLIAGSWAEPERPDGVLTDRSPADAAQVLGLYPHAVSQVGRAVAAAREAQPAFARWPVERRTALVRAIGAALQARSDDLARAIALDVGKPLWEARTEVAATVAKAAITVDEGLALVRGLTPPGTPAGPVPPAECRFRPLGVLAVLGPFNFPVHLPNGHILPALATGNAVVFKPSEVAPHAAEVYARCLQDSGVPPGVFNLVQGGPAEGAALCVQAGVDGVLFTGSWAVGQAILRANLGQTRLLALEMGGKNAALVLEDADLDKAIHDAAFSAFVSAGQRCTAASRAIVVGSAARADAFAARVAALARRLVVGHPLDEGVFMGPLASEPALHKFEAGLAQARAQGGVAQVLASARLSPRGLAGSYASPAVHRVLRRSGSAYETEELFGPDLAVHDASSLEEACAIANGTAYGLAASVHTADPARFERCLSLLECGVVNHNAPTVGASGRLPFGGLKRSGNHRPAGLFSTLYCTSPVAVLRGEPRLDRTKLSPGLTWVDE